MRRGAWTVMVWPWPNRPCLPMPKERMPASVRRSVCAMPIEILCTRQQVYGILTTFGAAMLMVDPCPRIPSSPTLPKVSSLPCWSTTAAHWYPMAICTDGEVRRYSHNRYWHHDRSNSGSAGGSTRPFALALCRSASSISGIISLLVSSTRVMSPVDERARKTRHTISASNASRMHRAIRGVLDS